MEVVGRAAELAAFPAFVAAVAGGPSGLVLEGPGGIGKTALWTAGAAIARDRGYRVLIARPAEAETQLPFAALGDLFAEIPEELLATLPGPQRRALDVAMLRADWDGSAIERQAVSLAVLGVLRALTAEAPLILALDDLQWLDAPSAAALQFALRRLDTERVGLLAARRVQGSEPAAGLAGSLPADRVQRLEIGPLDRDALSRLLADRLGVPLPRPALLQIHRVSAGNPFLALEIGRALERREVVLVPGEPFPLPQSLRELVRDRLDQLPPAARETGLAVAALPQPSVERVEAAGRGGDGLAQALAAGIVEIEGERVRFTHPLLGSILYSEASPARRRELHERLATLTEDGEERARHLALAATGPDAAVAAALDEAARRARLRGAPEAAAELLEQAAALTPGTDDDGRVRRTVDAAERHFEAGATERARELFETATAGAPGRELRLRAGARLGVVRLLSGDLAGATAALQQARKDAGGRDEVPAAVEEGLAWTSEFRGDSATAAKQARAAIRQAERQGDPVALTSALAAAALFEARIGQRSARQHLERALWLAALLDDLPLGRSHPVRIQAQLVMGSGELARAHALLSGLRERSLERGTEGSLSIVLATLCLGEARAGRWQEAARHAQEGWLSTLGTGQLAQRLFMLQGMTLVDALRGDEAETRARASEARELIARTDFDPLLANTDTSVGLLELSLGDFESAHRVLAPLAGRIPVGPVRESGWFRFLADEAETLVALGDLEAAGETVAKLEARRHTLLDQAWTAQAALRCRGIFEVASGDAETGLETLDDAVGLSERGQEPFEHARNLLALGRSQRRLKRRGAARDSLERAGEVFQRLGARLWHERAEEELARIGGRPRRTAGLTATERQVAELAAAGLTNREIAAAAFLSVNTVQAYLKRIYRELGIRSRTELARQLTPDQRSKSTDSGVSGSSPRP